MEKMVGKFSKKNNIVPEVPAPASSHGQAPEKAEDTADPSKDDLVEFLSKILWQDEDR